MNIQEAKDEIKKAITAYLAKDASWNPLIPVSRQRPIFLMGAPGIGKTAIIEQIAGECELPLLSYTMTHHTRQSVIGLPVIKESGYKDQTFSSTVYTMSEILAEVYRIMEASGKEEGILFLDEINCVSETLLPTMLQFLQFKTFGTHKLPEGWIVCAAGNPPRYNRSARDFDVVTLDRLKYLELEPDLSAWLSYAREKNLHSTIISYLALHPESFCSYQNSLEGRSYVTPRSWEDLSASLTAYEALKLSVSDTMFTEYLHSETIARDFGSYYKICRSILSDSLMDRLFSGEELTEEAYPQLSGLSSNEKLCILEALRSRLFSMAASLTTEKGAVKSLGYFGELLKKESPSFTGLSDHMELLLEKRDKANMKKKEFGLFSEEEARTETLFASYVRAITGRLLEQGSGISSYEAFKGEVSALAHHVQEKEALLSQSSASIKAFVSRSFGDCPESYMFFTELTEHPLLHS